MATSVSILALPCCNCFQALVKNPRPSQNTTGVDNAHMMGLAWGISMKNMPMMTTGIDKMMAQVVRNFNTLNFLLWASSASSSVLPSWFINKSYPAACTACCKASEEQLVGSYSTVAVAEA